MVVITSSNACHATSFSLNINKSLSVFNNILKSLPQQKIRGFYLAFYVYVACTIATPKLRMFSQYRKSHFVDLVTVKSVFCEIYANN